MFFPLYKCAASMAKLSSSMSAIDQVHSMQAWTAENHASQCLAAAMNGAHGRWELALLAGRLVTNCFRSMTNMKG